MVKQGNLEQPTFDDAMNWRHMRGNDHGELVDEIVTTLEQHGFLEREMCSEGIHTTNTVLTEKGLSLWEVLTVKLLEGVLEYETIGNFQQMVFMEHMSQHETFERIRAGSALRELLGGLIAEDGDTEPQDGSES